VSQDDPVRKFPFRIHRCRYGYGADRLSRNFQEIEALGDFTLPFKLDLGKTWELKSRLEFSLGSLGNDHVTAVVVPLGRCSHSAPSKSPVKLDGGFAPTGLSEP